MVRAWYFDALPGDQRKPHKGEDVSLDELEKIGVLYWKVSLRMRAWGWLRYFSGSPPTEEEINNRHTCALPVTYYK